MMWKDFLALIVFIGAVLSFMTTKAQKCGKVRSEFGGTIFGGEKSRKTEFPWMVALVDRKLNKFFCGGTLISAKHVLSGKTSIN